MPETLTEFGVRLPDGRVTVFRAREYAVEHIEYMRKTKRYGALVSREVTYTDWTDTGSPSGGPEPLEGT